MWTPPNLPFGNSKVWLLFCHNNFIYVVSVNTGGECNPIFPMHCSTADLYVLKNLKAPCFERENALPRVIIPVLIF